jgi:multidrug efflux pump subunit AcrB/outer membrane protein TolC
MKQLINYFIKYPFSGNILMILIFILGLAGLVSLRSTSMPQVDPGMIIVNVTYPGSSPEEIEKGIILKIESNLKGVSGIDYIKSISQENTGQITVFLETGFTADVVLQDVKNAIDGITSFPSGMEPPNVQKMEFKQEAVQFALSGNIDLKQLKQMARVIEDDLRGIDGISKVELSGFPDEEIEIAFKEADLQRLGMTLDEAFMAVKNANLDITGGTMRGATEELRVRAKEKQYWAKDMKNIVLRTTDSGAIVRLKDVATVQDKWAEDPNRSYLDGRQAVIFTIKYTAQEDIINISQSIHAYVDSFNKKHENLIATIFDDRSNDIKGIQKILVDNGLLGFILVLVFLSFALNMRLSIWVALSIPIAFMGMFMVGAMMGITLNRVSLFGMILVVGILVDDGIVIAENIFRRHEDGESNLIAALNGTIEVIPAVFAAVLTTIVAFSAFFFLDGMMGKMFMELAFVVIASLAFSLVEGALILPAHVAHSKALKEGHKASKLERFTNSSVKKLKDKFFAPALGFAMNNKTLTLIIPVALLLITLGAFKGGIIKSGDPNAEDASHIQIQLDMPSGTVEKETISVLDRIEKNAVKVGEEFNSRHKEGMTAIRTILTNIGPTNKGSVTVLLQNSQDRDYHSMTFANAMIKELGEIPEAERINFVQESHFGKAISVSLLSRNLLELDEARLELKSQLMNLKGLKNVLDDSETGMREIIVSLKDKAYLLGLDLGTVMGLVRNGIFGYEVQRLHRGMDEVKIWVRLQKEDRSSLSKMENMRIRLQDGRQIPLKEIANLEIQRNLVQIRHLNGRRQATVEADLTDPSVSMTAMNQELKTRILPELKEKFPSLSFYFGGREERIGKTADSAVTVIPVVFLLLLTVVIFTFRSFSQAMLLFLIVPFGLIGVGWGHAIHGMAVDLPSYFGMVALLGIMINDAIVLISTINTNKKKGKDFKTAIYEATLSRFRPILLTSLTTIAGLMPLIVSKNSEADMVIPMAISVSYGLIIATFVTLLVLPVMILVVEQLKHSIDKMSANLFLGLKKALKVSLSVILVLVLGLSLVYGEDGQNLSLEEALNKGLKNNFQVRIADKEKNIAQNNNTWGIAGRYPNINNSFKYDNNYNDTINTHTFTKSMDISWVIFDGFKVNINKNIMETLEQMGKVDAQTTMEQTIKDVTMAYYNVLLNHEKFKVSQEMEILSKDRYDREQSKLALGSSSTFEVQRAKTAWLSDRSNRVLQHTAVDNAIRNLNRLMGNEITIQYRLSDPFQIMPQDLEKSDTKQLKDQMMGNNHTIQTLTLNTTLLRKEVALQKSARWPKLSINSGMRWVSGSGLSQNNYYINLGISRSIFDGGKIKRAVANAKISEQIGQLKLLETTIALENQLKDIIALYDGHKQVYHTAKESLKSASISLKLAKEKFQVGAIDSFNYRDVQVSYGDASVKELQAIFDLIDSRTDLLQIIATGHPAPATD